MGGDVLVEDEIFGRKFHLAKLFTGDCRKTITVLGIFAIFYLREVDRIAFSRDNIYLTPACTPISLNNSMSVLLQPLANGMLCLIANGFRRFSLSRAVCRLESKFTRSLPVPGEVQAKFEFLIECLSVERFVSSGDASDAMHSSLN